MPWQWCYGTTDTGGGVIRLNLAQPGFSAPITAEVTRRLQGGGSRSQIRAYVVSRTGTPRGRAREYANQYVDLVLAVCRWEDRDRPMRRSASYVRVLGRQTYYAGRMKRSAACRAEEWYRDRACRYNYIRDTAACAIRETLLSMVAAWR